MATTRETAHLAIRELWGAANERLLASDAEPKDIGSVLLKRIVTAGGVTVSELGSKLIVEAAFDKSGGVEERVEVRMPEDIRDLSGSEVYVHWSTDYGMGDSGTKTAPMRDFPRIAKEFIPLL